MLQSHLHSLIAKAHRYQEEPERFERTSGEGEALRHGHADYYCTLAEAAQTAFWRSGRYAAEGASGSSAP